MELFINNLFANQFSGALMTLGLFLGLLSIPVVLVLILRKISRKNLSGSYLVRALAFPVLLISLSVVILFGRAASSIKAGADASRVEKEKREIPKAYIPARKARKTTENNQDSTAKTKINFDATSPLAKILDNLENKQKTTQEKNPVTMVNCQKRVEEIFSSFQEKVNATERKILSSKDPLVYSNKDIVNQIREKVSSLQQVLANLPSSKIPQEECTPRLLQAKSTLEVLEGGLDSLL